VVRTDIDRLHRTRQGWRQQAVAIAARGFDVLLEERLAVGKGAHQRTTEPALHLAFEVEGRFHHHHRVGFAIDGLALLHRHMKERIDVPGHGKYWHLASLE
jgi:hypothetical protein